MVTHADLSPTLASSICQSLTLLPIIALSPPLTLHSLDRSQNRPQYRRPELGVAEWDDGGRVQGAWLSSHDGAAGLMLRAARLILLVAGVDACCMAFVGLHKAFCLWQFLPQTASL